MLLSALGLYGLTALVFAQRSREFAIRIALGASPAQVKWLVLRQALRLGLAGGLVGYLMATVLAGIVRTHGLLIGLSATDPLTFGAAGLLMATVLLAGSLLPAQRAGSIDPVRSLRAE